MIIREFRVVLPLTVEEYQVAQLYSVAEASKNETGGGEGIEVIRNEPFEKFPLLGGQYNSGQYTYKIYHLASKVPGFIRMLAPKGSLEIHEEAWNAYPYCRTVLSNPDYMKDGFTLSIETMHCADRGTQENVHQLTPDKLQHRGVVYVDIANDTVHSNDYKVSEDPAKFKSKKTGRGPLSGDWIQTVNPVMCCYKLVTVEFKWFGLQGRVENFIQKSERRIFANFHRQVFCWMDQWHGMTMDDIRALEDKTKDELDKLAESTSQPPTPPFGASRSGSSGLAGDNFGFSSNQMVYLAPKQTWLPAVEGKGLELSGTVVRRGGQIFMDMTFKNKSMQEMSGFAIQLNKNSFGLIPAVPLLVPAPLNPYQSVDVSLLLTTNGPVQKMDPLNALQIAIQNNIDIFYFSTAVPMSSFFTEDGQMDKHIFLETGKDIPLLNEVQYTIQTFNTNADSISSKLQQNNIFTVAKQNVKGQDILYQSIKLTNGISVLGELKIQPGNPNITLSLKSRAMEVAPGVYRAFEDILLA